MASVTPDRPMQLPCGLASKKVRDPVMAAPTTNGQIGKLHRCKICCVDKPKVINAYIFSAKCVKVA
eukprot:2043928-Ditylum_brightwellii.AAC.1